MANDRFWRAAAGGSVAAIGAALAMWMGASMAGALLALFAGIAAAALVAPASAGQAAPQPIEPSGLPPLPDTLDLLQAVDDPLLIVRNRRVVYANPAARSVLGEHVEGVDVRLAIRHPAAAERLVDREPGDPGEPVTRTELVGLGERERRWEMTVTRLRDGSRLVRLIDRSQAHASEQMRTDFVAKPRTAHPTRHVARVPGNAAGRRCRRA
jgi:two-component system phosphate regulon sensor histidine kinase PhoR